VLRALAAGLATLLLAAGTGCDSGDDGAAAPPGQDPAGRTAEEPPLPPATLADHLRALQRIADENGGNRAAGTAGDRASVAYVRERLRGAGWNVRAQDVSFPFYRERSARLRVGGRELRRGEDFRPIVYSGSGRVAGRAAGVGNGCERSDFEGLGGGEIALAERGDCFFRVKAENAERAGAGALLVADKEGGEVPAATLGEVGANIPALIVSADAGVSAGDRVELEVDATSERRRTQNVIAETPGGSGQRVVMAGAHLDSVANGPGLNDNGSGVAALLEAAEEIGPRPPGARIRLAFWGAEELGLIGSRRYVRSLDERDRRRIAAYLNFDMVGSPNGRPAVYSDGDPALAQLLRRAAGRRLPGESTGGASDHAPFEAAGVPVNGLYTGASEEGRGGEPRDPCYHRSCDRLRNVNRPELAEMTAAIETALRRLSAREG
jgi:Zn-dependent M28 family amino/carboxypeptidase